jgi:hypothetical protein
MCLTIQRLNQIQYTSSIFILEQSREVKTSHKRKKKRMSVKLLRKQHECRKFCKVINMARKQFKPRVIMCRSEGGLLTSNEQEILDRWVRHFDKLLKGRKHNEGFTFTTISSNQTSKEKTGNNRCLHYWGH